MTRQIVMVGGLLVGFAGCGADGDATESTDGSGGTTETTAETTSGSSTGGTESGQATESGSSGERSDQLLDRVVERLGGAETVLGIENLSYSITGRVDAHSETSDPDIGPPRLEHGLSGDVVYDLAGDRIRYDYVRDVAIVGVVVEQTELYVDDRGTYVGAGLIGLPGSAMTPDRVGSAHRQIELETPQELIADVLRGSRTAHTATSAVFDGEPVDVLRLSDDNGPMDLFVDPESDEVLGLSVLENDLVLRDAETTVRYDGWVEVDGGVLAPTKVTIAVEGYLIREETRSGYVTNQELSDETFEFEGGLPPNAELAALGRNTAHSYQMVPAGFADGRPPLIIPEPVVPGVEAIRGLLHNSVIVQQVDGLVVLEAGGYPERSEALLGHIEQNYPGQRIKTLGVTHHHFDVIGGVRAFLASGAELVVSSAAENFWTRVLEAPSTIVPDLLAESQVVPTTLFVPTGGELIVDDPTHPIEAHHVAARHAEDSVIYYLPEQGVLVVSDLYSPGFPFMTEETIWGAEDLNDALLELDVPGDTIIVAGVGIGTPTVDDFREEFQL